MGNKIEQLKILKEIDNNRSVVCSLPDMYVRSTQNANDDYSKMIDSYQQLMDIKDEVRLLISDIDNSKKSDRAEIYLKNKSKLKKFHADADTINDDFSSSLDSFKNAIKYCNELTKQYKHNFTDLYLQFNATIDENTDESILKGYRQQIRLIKFAFEKIKLQINAYKNKKQIVDDNTEKFNKLYNEIDTLIHNVELTA